MQQFTNTERDLFELAKIVSNGGVVIYPTDTVYGLGCDPYNERAVEKIFQIKIRENKPLPLLCNSLDYAQEVAYFDQISIKLADKFWPGPLTIILPIKDEVLKLLTCNTDFIGLRVPDNKVTLSLLLACGGYLVGTSANISGNESHYVASSVISELENFDAILIDDPITRNMESTVVQVKDNDIEIIRSGSIDKQLILSVL